MPPAQLQSAIVQCLRNQTPKEKNLADELAALLNLGRNAVYKRLEGSTPFTLEDLEKLSRHFQIPWLALFHPGEPAFPAEFSGFAAPTSCLE
ncbi:MAG: helix-turn-helix domain-containing protein, partial [Bacteroidota bacterium]